MATGFSTSKTPYMTKKAYEETPQRERKKIRLAPTPNTVVESITHPERVVGVDGQNELKKMLKKFE